MKSVSGLHLFAGLLLGAAFTGCTGQVPGSFRLAQQEEVFSSQLQINTKIDLLWVVDNSSSMDVSQEKLRKGFANFANRYMQPTWDIRVAVITTDAYLANPVFEGFLDQVVPMTGPPWQSPYMASRTLPSVNPIYNPDTKMFDDGVRYRDLVPVWGAAYAKLLPWVHDGPIAGLCFEGLPYFLKGPTKCAYRDDSLARGPEACLQDGATALKDCVNTVENDSVHSGKAIIATSAPASVLRDPAQVAAWRAQLIKDFMVNVTTGSVGFGSERGLSSLLQLLEDNEQDDTAFFRPGSLRGIIFVSDEEDQSMTIPASAPAVFSPWAQYKCDQANLLAKNSASPNLITGNGGYCCSDPAKGCRYGSEGTSCPSKTVDGLTYTPSLCAAEDKLIPVATVKGQIDGFFRGLDAGLSSEDKDDELPPNYFVASIVPMTADSITRMQQSRDADDLEVGMTIKTQAVDRGDRYIGLGNLVGNGSLAMDIGADDYSPILDAIGKSIIEKKSVFTLVRAPTGTEEMMVTVIHADGSVEVIPPSKFVIEGRSLRIIDQDMVLGFASTDRISINYQPKTLY